MQGTHVLSDYFHLGVSVSVDGMPDTHNASTLEGIRVDCRLLQWMYVLQGPERIA